MQNINNSQYEQEELENIVLDAIKNILTNQCNANKLFFDVMETVFELPNIQLSAKCIFLLEYIYDNLIKDSDYPYLFKEKYRNFIYQYMFSYLFYSNENKNDNISLTSIYFKKYL